MFKPKLRMDEKCNFINSRLSGCYGKDNVPKDKYGFINMVEFSKQNKMYFELMERKGK